MSEVPEFFAAKAGTGLTDRSPHFRPREQKQDDNYAAAEAWGGEGGDGSTWVQGKRAGDEVGWIGARGETSGLASTWECLSLTP